MSLKSGPNLRNLGIIFGRLEVIEHILSQTRIRELHIPDEDTQRDIRRQWDIKGKSDREKRHLINTRKDHYDFFKSRRYKIVNIY